MSDIQVRRVDEYGRGFRMEVTAAGSDTPHTVQLSSKMWHLLGGARLSTTEATERFLERVIGAGGELDHDIDLEELAARYPAVVSLDPGARV